MSRLRQVASETEDPVVLGMYDIVFGKGVDPLADGGAGTDTGSRGDWWTTSALVPDVLEHAVAGFVLYRSPDRRLAHAVAYDGGRVSDDVFAVLRDGPPEDFDARRFVTTGADAAAKQRLRDARRERP